MDRDPYLVFGYSSRLYPSHAGTDDALASLLQPCWGREDNLVDRYDCRLLLEEDEVLPATATATATATELSLSCKEIDCGCGNGASARLAHDCSNECLENDGSIDTVVCESTLDEERWRALREVEAEVHEMSTQQKEAKPEAANSDSVELATGAGAVAAAKLAAEDKNREEEEEGIELWFQEDDKFDEIVPEGLAVAKSTGVPRQRTHMMLIVRTAVFVASNEHGSQMEILLRAKLDKQPKMRFLIPGHPLNALYMQVLSQVRDGSFQPAAPTVAPATSRSDMEVSVGVEEAEVGAPEPDTTTGGGSAATVTPPPPSPSSSSSSTTTTTTTTNTAATTVADAATKDSQVFSALVNYSESESEESDLEAVDEVNSPLSSTPTGPECPASAVSAVSAASAASPSLSPPTLKFGSMSPTSSSSHDSNYKPPTSTTTTAADSTATTTAIRALASSPLLLPPPSPHVKAVVIPPPDAKEVIDKLVDYVKEHGTAFEERLQAHNIGDKRFAFLHERHPYHAYYRSCIAAARCCIISNDSEDGSGSNNCISGFPPASKRMRRDTEETTINPKA